MQEWIDKIKKLITGKSADDKPVLLTSVATDYEVNLVPDVKIQMIKALKMRNLVLFICIVVAAASIGVVLILFSIKSGQDIMMASQDKRLDAMSIKLNDYEELDDLVTIQRQLDMISQLSGDKPVLSRVFGALDVVLPQGNDVVQLSELRVNLEDNTLRFEGQADARTAPLIDYRVLEALKKGMALSKYDYGRFVDAMGNEIPTWCINEADENGDPYRDGENYYVWWDLSTAGCAAVEEGSSVTSGDDAPELYYSSVAEVESEEVEVSESVAKGQQDGDEEDDDDEEAIDLADVEERVEGDQVKYYREEVKRVKIWRTPQFEAWHKSGYMELNGSITGIEHFESECTQYSGTMQSGDGSVAKWTSTNECMLAPQGMDVLSSTNGRDESDNLVLKFTASVQIVPEFFEFKNKHMIAIGPMGQNVTDSYMQIGGMFTQEARECAAGDTECLTTATTSDSEEDE